ncbi:hypothetical protein CHUAL_012491 [Chamberlinius hualienensis]
MFNLSVLLIALCCYLAASSTLSEETKYVDDEYTRESNVTFICSVCECDRNTLSNPFNINCQYFQLEEFYDWDPFMINTTEIFNIHLQMQHNYMQVVYQLKENTAVDALYLDNNIIKGIDPFAFAFLPNLKRLSLSNNLLDSLHPNAFSCSLGSPTSQIEVLDLSYNHLSNLDGDIFDNLHNLVELNLQGNPFGTLDPSTQLAIITLTSLTKLNLADTGLAEIPKSLSNVVKHLVELNLESNRFQDVPQVLNNGNYLQVLILDRTQIIHLSKTSLKGFHDLRVLSVSYMPYLTTISAGTFHSLEKLENLKCHDNYILNSIDEGAFNNHHGSNSLELELSSNNFTFLKESLFENIEIRLLDVRNNSFNCDCDLAWVQNQKMPPHYKEEIKCAQPYLLKGKSLSEVDFDILEESSCKKPLTKAAESVKELFTFGMPLHSMLGIAFVIIVITLLLAIVSIIALFIRKRKDNINIINFQPLKNSENNNLPSTNVPYQKLTVYQNDVYDNDYWDD